MRVRAVEKVFFSSSRSVGESGEAREEHEGRMGLGRLDVKISSASEDGRWRDLFPRTSLEKADHPGVKEA